MRYSATGISDAPVTTPRSLRTRLAHRLRPRRRHRRGDRPVVDRRDRQRGRHRLQALPRHLTGRLRHPGDALQRHELHRLHRGDRHDLLLRRLRTRRGRQRGAQVTRVLCLRGRQHPAARHHAAHRPGLLAAVDHAGDNGGAIDLSWTAATDNVAVTGYKLYRGTSPGTYGTPVTLTTATSYTDSTAVTGTTYYYAVAALDAAGNEGPKSPEASASAVNNSAPPDTAATDRPVCHRGTPVGRHDRPHLDRQPRDRLRGLRPVPRRRQGQLHR